MHIERIDYVVDNDSQTGPVTSQVGKENEENCNYTMAEFVHNLDELVS